MSRRLLQRSWNLWTSVKSRGPHPFLDEDPCYKPRPRTEAEKQESRKKLETLLAMMGKLM